LLSEYKQFIQKIGLIGVAQLLIGLSGIIFIPILTKSLSIEDYGTWVLLTVTIGLIPSLVMLGLPYTMVRFLAAIKNREEIQEGFYSIAIVVAIIAFLTSITLFLLSDQIATVFFNNQILVTQILCCVIFMECINGFLINYFRTFQQMLWYSVLMIMRSILQVLLIYFLIIRGYGIVGAILGLLITNSILFAIMSSKIFFEIGFVIPKFLHLQEYFEFCLPTIPGTLSNWIVESSNRFVIGLYLGAAFVGYFSPAYSLGYIISMFSAPLLIILPPVLSKYYDDNNKEIVKKILTFSLKYYLAIAIPSIIGLSLLSKPLLILLSTHQIALNGYFVTPFIAASGLLLGLYLIFSQILTLVKNTMITGKIWILAAILSFLLNFVLVPWIGLLGAAITTLIAYVIAFVFTFYYSLKYLTFDLNLIFIIKCFSASFLMGIVIIYLTDYFDQNILNIAFLIMVSGLVYTISLFILGGFKKDELTFFCTIFDS
jgi:O-antigen/teichoic acid export membrane protein